VAKVVLAGSRSKLCINEKVRKESLSHLDFRLGCNQLGAGCEYKIKLLDKEGKLKIDKPRFAQEAFDIEDLHKLGEKHKICPYYMQKNRAQYSDFNAL
jgi:regulator of telomere elongation helicase 1